jgi:3-oxoadipate enol-lactonase
MLLLDRPMHRLNYRIDGRPGDPWLLFCNSLGTDLTMWDAQVTALADDFRILRYDRRGHGLSSTPPAPYTLADLGGDVLALLDTLQIENVHFCGLSIGGLTGQWLGIHARARIDRLVVAATSARIGTDESWAARIEAVRRDGLKPLVSGTQERWFSEAFRAAEPTIVSEILDRFVGASVEGYAGCCAALKRADLRPDIHRITCPVLAISGADDPVCPPTDLQQIASAVADGRHVSLPGRHLVNVESAQAFTAAIRDFFRADAN